MKPGWIGWLFVVLMLAVVCQCGKAVTQGQGGCAWEEIEVQKHSPFLLKAAEAGLRAIQFPCSVEERGGRVWSITAKDCLEKVVIDGRVIYERKGEDCSHCDRCNPVRVELPDDLEPGPHEVRFEVRVVGEEGWLDVRQLRPFPWLGVLGGVGVVGGVMGVAAAAGRRIEWWQYGLGGVAVIVAVAYFWSTGPWTRQNDVGGHREYIDHLLSEGSLPKVKQGWETHQPPFYYAIASVWVALGERVSEIGRFRLVQVLAGATYLLTVGIAIAWFRAFGLSRLASAFGLALFILLPAHVYLSGKINNDTLMPLWGLIMVLLGWDYLQEQRRRTLVALAGVLLMAVMTKMSSLSLVAAAGMILLIGELEAGASWKRMFKRAVLLGLPTGLWLVFWLSRNWQQTGELLYVNSALPPSLLVENGLGRYFSFDPSVLWRGDSIYASGIKSSFPTALYGSLTTGDFGFDYLNQSALPLARATLAVVGLVFVVGLFWRSKARTNVCSPWLPAVIVLFYHAVFMIAYNLQYPYACNQDARLWAPAFFAGCVVVACGYDRLQGRVIGPCQWVVMGLPWLFVVSVAVFYWQVITY